MGRPHIVTLRSGNLRHQETLYHHSWCCIHFVTVSIPVETKKSEGLTINAQDFYGSNDYLRSRWCRYTAWICYQDFFRSYFWDLALTTSRGESGCVAAAQATAWLGSFSVPMNVLLFIVRADAVFLRNPRFRVIFGLLWIATLVSFMTPFSVTGISIPVIHRCSVEKVNRTTGVINIAIVSAVDTILFLTITARVVNWYNQEQRNLFSRCGRVSRVLLSTGQLYYFYVDSLLGIILTIGSYANTYLSPVVTLNIFSMTVLLVPSVSPDYQALALLLSVAFQNMMTCRVFVLLYLGALHDDLFLSVN